MTLPVYSNPISLGQIQTEFGGSNPASISEYYSGGSQVATGTSGYPLGVQTAIPTSGPISFSNFYGSTSVSATPTTPSYYMSPASVTRNEGNTVVFTITVSNVPNSTTLYWTTSGTGITTADFSDGLLTGSVTTVSNSASFSRTIASDTVTEGQETATFNLRTGSISGPIVASSTLVINDTSLAPSTPTYVLSSNIASVNEGSAVTISLATTNVTTGTEIYYTITGVSPTDLGISVLTGLFFTANDITTQTFNIAADMLTEGSETLTLTLDGMPDHSISVTINDTSVAPSASSDVELLTYFWNNKNGLVRSTGGLGFPFPPEVPGSSYVVASTYPGNDAYYADHFNSYDTIRSSADFNFSDTGTTSIITDNWTVVTWTSGIDLGGTPYWETPPGTPTLVGGTSTTIGPVNGHVIAVSHVTAPNTAPPSSIYAKWVWKNYLGDNNLGNNAYSMLIPGNWDVTTQITSPSAPEMAQYTDSQGYPTSNYSYSLPAGAFSLFLGQDAYADNSLISEPSQPLNYTGSNHITASLVWYNTTGVITAVNNTSSPVVQSMAGKRQFTNVVDSGVKGVFDSITTWADTNLLTGGHGLVLIFTKVT